MHIIVLFGLPATGKTFVGRVMQNHFGFYFHDGDSDLPEEMNVAIKNKMPVTDAMRDVFFQNILDHVEKLQKEHARIVVAQTYIKEKYRQAFLDAYPSTQFMLIETNNDLREERLAKRKVYPLDMEYARAMCKNFQPPRVPHLTIKNDEEGEALITQQLSFLTQNPLFLEQ